VFGTHGSYITWLRVSEEYMKVIAVSLRPAAEGPGGAAAVVTVQRGLWGSTPRAHGANASVLAPIYHSKGGWPEGGSGHVRYALDQSRLWVAQYNAAAVGTTACRRSLSPGVAHTDAPLCPSTQIPSCWTGYGSTAWACSASNPTTLVEGTFAG